MIKLDIMNLFVIHCVQAADYVACCLCKITSMGSLGCAEEIR